jgi:hypothetical protein
MFTRFCEVCVFLFAVDETLCCGAEAMILSIHVTGKANKDCTDYSEQFAVGSSYCAQKLAKGGTCAFVRKNLQFNQRDTKHHSNGQDKEWKRDTYVLAIRIPPTVDSEPSLNKSGKT